MPASPTNPPGESGEGKLPASQTSDDKLEVHTDKLEVEGGTSAGRRTGRSPKKKEAATRPELALRDGFSEKASQELVEVSESFIELIEKLSRTRSKAHNHELVMVADVVSAAKFLGDPRSPSRWLKAAGTIGGTAFGFSAGALNSAFQQGTSPVAGGVGAVVAAVLLSLYFTRD